MKTILIMLSGIVSFCSCSKKSDFDQIAGNLRLAIDNTSKITPLENISDRKNYLAQDEASYLIEFNKYSADSVQLIVRPESMKIVGQNQAGTWVLKFDRNLQNEKVNVLPTSVMNVRAVNGGPELVRPSKFLSVNQLTPLNHGVQP